MSKARLVITAVTVEKRPVSEVARAYGVARSWIYTLLERYRAEGEAAFEPRSWRPKTSPAAISDGIIELIVRARKELSGRGLDAGPHTICWHLRHHHQAQRLGGDRQPVSDRGRPDHPQPKKRPKSSYLRFAAELPNQCWQSDFTHYRLTRPDGSPGPDAEILGWLDDHSRLVLSLTAHRRVTGPYRPGRLPRRGRCPRRPGLDADRTAWSSPPAYPAARAAATAWNTSCAGGVTQKNGLRNHPQTQGKVERFWQTLKKWLAAQPRQPATTGQLQALLDAFTACYNHQRPHKSLPGLGHPRHRVCRPAQSHPRRPGRRHPRPRPHRHHRRHRLRHPPPRRQALPHRHRPHPRPNPRPAANPRPGHPHHQRRHRRAAPPAHPRPRPQLPAHPAPNQTHARHTPPTQTPRT